MTPLMFIILFWMVELTTQSHHNGIQFIFACCDKACGIKYFTTCLEPDECCYIYGSVPNNDTFYVPEGEAIFLNYIIYNPHDNFTNLTVTWFRSDTEDSFEAIPITSEGYKNFQYEITRAQSNTSLSSLMRTCSCDIFRDTYSLKITNFSEHENGYYRCQLAINNILFVQLSHHVRLYARERNSISCPVTFVNCYFRPANSISEYQCANLTTLVPPTMLLSITSTQPIQSTPLKTATLPGVTSIPTTTEPEKGSRRLIIIYVTGGLSALIVVFGALIVALSVLYLCKFRNRQKSKPLIIIIYYLLLI